MISRIIPNFPEPYEREFFYHTIARAMDQMHGIGEKSKSILLFGSCKRPRFDIPNHIFVLSSRLGNVIDPREIIQNHSIYPFYNLFLTKEKQISFEETVLNHKRDPSCFTLGLPTKLNLSTMRYCPVCLKKHQRAGLPLYPKVEWQLPGIDICPFDHTYLHEYPLLDEESINRQYLVMNPSRISFEANECLDKDLINISNLALDLFNLPISIFSREQIRVKINSLLDKNGYFEPGEQYRFQFNFRRFQEDLNRRYSPEILEKLPSEPLPWIDPTIFKHSWLGKILLNYAFPTIPFYWLIIINFFCESMSEFLNIDYL